MRSHLKRWWLFPENVPLVLRPNGFDDEEGELRLNLCHSDNSRDPQGFLTSPLGLNVFYDPSEWRYHPICIDASPTKLLEFYNRYKRFEKPPFECEDLFDHLYVEEGFGEGLSLSTIESYRWSWPAIARLGTFVANDNALALGESRATVHEPTGVFRDLPNGQKCVVRFFAPNTPKGDRWVEFTNVTLYHAGDGTIRFDVIFDHKSEFPQYSCWGMYYPDRTATQVIEILATHYGFKMPDFDPLSVFYMKEEYLDVKETMPPFYGKSFQYIKEYNERAAATSPSTSTSEAEPAAEAEPTSTSTSTLEPAPEDEKGVAVVATITKLAEQISAAQELIYHLQGLVST
jgi:hypothetical protein